MQQPTFKLINTQGQVATTFLGTAFINMGASPSGSEPLYLGPCNINGVCGFQASGTSAFVNIIDGFITFSVSSWAVCDLSTSPSLVGTDVCFALYFLPSHRRG